MSIFRLLLCSLLIAATVAAVAAQSASEKNSVVVQSIETRHLIFPSGDLFASNLQAGLKPNAMDRILVGDYRPQLSQFNVPRTWLRTDLDSQLPAENLCLKMRTYKVAPDSPHSDSTHPVGYSTCQPAARFQTRSIVLRVPPSDTR
jgi:hypothetical protein